MIRMRELVVPALGAGMETTLVRSCNRGLGSRIWRVAIVSRRARAISDLMDKINGEVGGKVISCNFAPM